jgi:GNAT superfamily N-acetyltransferase
MSAVTIALTAAPSVDELAAISGGLAAFNDADAGAANRVPLALLVRDPAGGVVGGLSGYTAWGWLYVQWLWLDARLRGQGLAARLLADAEAEARARGCHGAWIDTFNPVALKVYVRAGYTPFGELEDFPAGRSRTFLRKPL